MACLTLRENTERPIMISEGSKNLAGTGAERIVKSYKRIMDEPYLKAHQPDFWDGETASRILKILKAR